MDNAKSEQRSIGSAGSRQAAGPLAIDPSADHNGGVSLFGSIPYGDVIQRKADGSVGTDDVDGTAKSGFAGAGGSVPYRSEMEQSFGRSFSGVHAHTGTEAAGASRALGAEAYAVGNHVAFRSSSPSKEVVAHELAHVGQQSGSAGSVQTLRLGSVGDRAEREASLAAGTVMAGGRPVISAMGAGTIRRWEAGEHAMLGDSGYLLGVMQSFADKKLGKPLTPEETKQLQTTLLDKGKQAAMMQFQQLRTLDDGQMQELNKMAGFQFTAAGGTKTRNMGHGEVYDEKLPDENYSYGEGTAMGGDFASTADGLGQLGADDVRKIKVGIAGEREFTEKQRKDPGLGESFPDYSKRYVFMVSAPFLTLAQSNYEHFAAGTIHQYGTNHARALELAHRAKVENKPELLTQALTYNAFADHFLSDSFCSGHIRTPRKEIKESPRVKKIFWTLKDKGPDLLSKLVHDIDNRRGLWVQCVAKPDMGSWRTFGDQRLGQAPKTIEVAGQAVAASVKEVYDVFATGTQPQKFEAFDFFPVLDNSKHEEGGEDVSNEEITQIFREHPEYVEEIRKSLPGSSVSVISQGDVEKLVPLLEGLSDQMYGDAGNVMAPKNGESEYQSKMPSQLGTAYSTSPTYGSSSK